MALDSGCSAGVGDESLGQINQSVKNGPDSFAEAYGG
jgi:hypothetical protein